MRVLLVYSNRTRIMEPAPPIGLSYVATAAQRAGHEVRFVDLMISRDPHGELRAALYDFAPEVVGFSVRNIDNIIAQSISWQINEVSTLIAITREHSRAQIVLGGPAISILGGRRAQAAGRGLCGGREGEVTFPQLLSAIGGSRDFSGISGLCYRANHKVMANAPLRLEEFGGSGMEQWIRWRPYERAGST